MKKLALMLCLIGLSGQVWAENWVYIGATGGATDNMSVYVDVDTIANNRAWFRWNHTKPQKIHGTNTYYSYSVYYAEMDCYSMRNRKLSTTYYSRSGRVVDTTDRSSSWSYIVPGSIGEVMYKVVCNRPAR